MAIIAVTGLVYLAGSVGIEPSARSMTPAPPEVSQTTTLDQCLALLPGRAQGLDIRLVVLPEKVGEPMVVMGQGAALLTADNANRVTIDPVRCAPTRQLLADRQNGLVRLFLAANPLHFGTFGGLFTKVLWFCFGSVLTAISITGAIIYSQRIVRDLGSKAPEAILRWYGGHGGWKYPAFGIVVATVLITVLALLGPLSFALDDWHLW
jgi:hypothetical protein